MNGDHELVQQWAGHLRVERNLSPNTVLAYVTDLYQFAEVLQRERDATLFTAGKDDVSAFVHHLATHEIGAKSRARKITALRRFYHWLIQAERLETDPTRLMPAPKLPQSLPKPIEQTAVETILHSFAAAAAGDSSNALALRNLAVVELLYGGGLRVSELCGLREGDIALTAGTARVQGKGRKERVVPIGNSAVAAVRSYLELGRPRLIRLGKGRQRAIFLSEQGRQLSRRRVHQVVSRGSGNSTDEHIYPHRMRHSLATHMLDHGADLRIVQEQLGHKSLATTQIYTGVSTGQLQDAHRKFHPRG